MPEIKADDSSNVLAYTASATAPLPFRFKSSNLIFQVPDLGFGTMMQRIKFFRIMSETPTWRSIASAFHTIKTWFRRSIWGDRVRIPIAHFSTSIY